MVFTLKPHDNNNNIFFVNSLYSSNDNFYLFKHRTLFEEKSQFEMYRINHSRGAHVRVRADSQVIILYSLGQIVSYGSVVEDTRLVELFAPASRGIAVKRE